MKEIPLLSKGIVLLYGEQLDNCNENCHKIYTIKTV